MWKKVENRVKKNTKNDFLSKLPKDLKQSLNCQENLFKLYDKYEKKTKSLGRLIRDKVKRDESNDLLINMNQSSNMKKEILGIIEKKNGTVGNDTINKWAMSLRKGGSKDEARIAYVNIGNHENPIWTVIREKKRERLVSWTRYW